MTSKEFLDQGYRIDVMIDAKVEQIANLRNMLTKLNPEMTDMPKNPNRGTSKVEDTIVKIVSLEEEVNRDVDRLIDIKDKIMKAIDAVPDKQERTLLTLRYLNYKTWEEIAFKLNCSVRYVHVIHSRALVSVKVPK